MSNKLNRKTVGTDIGLNWLVDTKFKHNRISVNFIVPISEETSSDNAMVMLLLRKGPKNYPSFAAFNAKLNSLYGASVIVNISKFNQYQYVSIGMSFLNNNYAMKKEDLVKECTSLLLDLIFSPNLDENGLFYEKNIELERQYLIDTIEAEINDKRSYAVSRMREEMFKGTPIALSEYGTLNSAKKVTAQSVTNAWKSLLEKSQIEIMFVGSGKPDTALELFGEKFSGLKRTAIEYKLLKTKTKAEKVNEITERMDGVQQSKLVMGFCVDGLDSREQIDATRLFVSAYGGTPFSKLFLNVREKLSLCYYCAARLDSVNNLMTIDSGLEEDKVDQAKAEIKKQLEGMQAGELTEEELQNTKLIVANSLSSVNDSLSALEGWYILQILKGSDLSPEEDIENIKKINRQQVIDAANKVSLDTVYLIAGKED